MTENHRTAEGRHLHVPSRPVTGTEGARRWRNHQTPDLIAHIVTEKHRAKLARDGSDTH